MSRMVCRPGVGMILSRQQNAIILYDFRGNTIMESHHRCVGRTRGWAGVRGLLLRRVKHYCLAMTRDVSAKGFRFLLAFSRVLYIINYPFRTIYYVSNIIYNTAHGKLFVSGACRTVTRLARFRYHIITPHTHIIIIIRVRSDSRYRLVYNTVGVHNTSVIRYGAYSLFRYNIIHIIRKYGQNIIFYNIMLYVMCYVRARVVGTEIIRAAHAAPLSGTSE